MVPAVAETETEKLIREKDEEVRHADHELESHHDHEHESAHSFDHYEHSDPHPSPERHLDQKADEALWVSKTKTNSDHILWDWASKTGVGLIIE